MQPAKSETTKYSLKEDFPQGLPEVTNIPVTESEVSHIITFLRNKYSNGYDGISNKINK